jgi:hypothetical protein
MDDNRKRESSVNGATSGFRRLTIVTAGIGLGAALAYLISKALGGFGSLDRIEEQSFGRRFPDHIVDDHGTGQGKAAEILRNLRDRAFEASDEKLAVALGRPMEEVTAWYNGQELIDDDVVMKARGIAIHRGVNVE